MTLEGVGANYSETPGKLRRARSEAVAEIRKVIEDAEAANGGKGRALTRAERRTTDGKNAEIVDLTKRIEAAERDKRNLESELRGKYRDAGSGVEAEFNRYMADQFRSLAQGNGLIGGESRDLTTAGAFTGALVPTDYELYVWDRLHAQAVALKTNPTIIQTDRHSITLPHLLTDAAASWVAEGGAISETDPTGESIVVTPSKVAALNKFSRESADDSNPAIADIIGKNLTRSIALAVDKAFFEGTGSSNQPTGLKNVSGITTQSMGTNGASPANLDFLLTALATLEAANADMSKVVIVAPARTVNDLFALKDSQNRYLMSSVTAGGASARSIEGVPIYTSNQLTLTETQGSSNVANSAYVYDASQVIVVQSHGMRLEATNDAYFSTDQIGIRCITRVGFAVPNPTAVVRVVGVLA